MLFSFSRYEIDDRRSVTADGNPLPTFDLLKQLRESVTSFGDADLHFLIIAI